MNARNIVAEGFNNIAVCYRDGGAGVEQDKEKAIKNFKLAADNNKHGRTYKEPQENLKQMGVKYVGLEKVWRILIGALAGASAIGLMMVLAWVFANAIGISKVSPLISLPFFAGVSFAFYKLARWQINLKIPLLMLALAIPGWLVILGIVPMYLDPSKDSSAKTEQAAPAATAPAVPKATALNPITLRKSESGKDGGEGRDGERDRHAEKRVADGHERNRQRVGACEQPEEELKQTCQASPPMGLAGFSPQEDGDFL